MNKTIKNIGCSILAGVMGCSLVNFPLFAAEEDQPSTKTETVYTVLNEDGTVQDSIVSSWLHDDDGINHISETLDLDDVENIKGDEKPVVNGKEYTWNVKGNDVYYQGKTTKKLPLSISIQYKLDGKPVCAKELEGKSGKLEMTITFKNNIDKVIDANGKKVTIHPSYLAGGMIDLDTDIYSDVQCRQGKIVNDGKNEMLAFATIPGLAQTLDEAGLNTVTKKMDLSDTIVITANVKDYKETEIMMAATNEFDAEDIEGVDSVSDLTGGINELIAASEQINDGTHQLADGTSQLKQGIAPLNQVGPQMDQLSAGATQLYEGSGQLAEGLSTMKSEMAPLANAYPQIDQLIQGSEQLASGSSQLQNGLLEYTAGVAKLDEGNQKLQQVPTELSKVNKYLKDIKQGNSALVGGSEQINSGIASINGQLAQIDQNKLDELAEKLKTADQQLDGLQTGIEQSEKVLDEMNTTVESSIQALSGMETLISAINQEMETINSTIDTNNQKIEVNNEKINNANAEFEQIKQEYIAQIDNAISALQNAQVDQQYQIPTTNTVTDPDGSTHEEVTYQEQNVHVDFSEEISKLSQQRNALAGATNLNDLQSLDRIDATKLNDYFDQIKNGLTQMGEIIKNSKANLNTLSTNISASKQVLAKMGQELGSVQLPSDIDQLKEGMKQLQAGAASLESGLKAEQTGISALQTGVENLDSSTQKAVKELNAGSSKLVEQNNALNNGAAEIASGTKKIADQKDQLNELKNGLGRLSQGVDQLSTGADQLHDGTKQLYDSKDQLNELKNGLNELQSGVDQLDAGAQKLRDGSDQFQQQGMGQLKEKLDLTTNEVNTLFDIVNAIQELNKENSSFTGAPEGADTTVRYVFRTEEDTDEE